MRGFDDLSRASRPPGHDEWVYAVSGSSSKHLAPADATVMPPTYAPPLTIIDFPNLRVGHVLWRGDSWFRRWTRSESGAVSGCGPLKAE
jgi:hypothetical protein